MAEDGAARPRLRIDAAGASADDAEHTLGTIDNGIDWRIARTVDDCAYRYAAIGDAGMTLSSSRMRGRIIGDIPPGDDSIVQWLTSATATVDVGRDPIVQTPEVPTLFPAHRTMVFDSDQRILHLGRTGSTP